MAAAAADAVTLGKGGLPRVLATHSSGASLEVYLHGATITSFKTAAGEEVLFVSSRAIFDGVKPIRGGIPIAFPQFAAQGPLPQHGFARNSTWTFRRAAEGYVELGLADSEATRAVWPHAFQLVYRISFDGTSLTTALDVMNPEGSAGPFAFEALLHSYFRIGAGNIGGVAVRGLRGVSYLSKPEGNVEKEDADEAIAFGGEIDRIYQNTPADVAITGILPSSGAAGATPITVTVHRHAGSRATHGLSQAVIRCPLDVVVWNAGAAKCASIADFGPEDWRDYVCVEPGRVSPATKDFPAHAALQPGKQWTITQVIKVE